jgi:Tol biopolymer transport system component
MVDLATAPRLFSSQRAIFAGLSCLLLGAVITGLAFWNLRPASAPRRVVRFTITLPSGDRLSGGVNDEMIALSPDGSHLAYIAIRGGKQQIYARAMDSLEVKPVPGTEGATILFFSPDGQWLVFFTGGKLEKVSMNGGAPIALGDALNPRGASWSSDGKIVFAAGGFGVDLQQISDGGGMSQPLTSAAKGQVQRWPELLPGGKALLFVTAVSRNWDNAQIVVQSVGTGERRNLIQAGTQPRYAPSGHLIYAQGGNLMAVPFDSQRSETTGPEVPTVEGVLHSSTSGAAQYSISATGTLAYVAGDAQETQSRLVWVNRNGTEQPLSAPAHNYRAPRLAPDGRRFAVSIEEEGQEVWIYDLSREALTRFTSDRSGSNTPAWTRDGKRIAFSSTREGPANVFLQNADGSGGLERLSTSENTQVPFDWSPDGKILVFMQVAPATGYDLWFLRMGDRKTQPFLRTRSNEAAPKFSPDGRWLAYISDESGHYEVYVQPYPGPGGKWQISTEGGTEPVWNPNGRELFYRTGDKMMAVDISMQSSFSAGKPRVLFSGPYIPTPLVSPNYDVSADGQRFLMIKPVEQQQAPTQINIVLNWFEELRRKVPPGTK